MKIWPSLQFTNKKIRLVYLIFSFQRLSYDYFRLLTEIISNQSKLYFSRNINLTIFLKKKNKKQRFTTFLKLKVQKNIISKEYCFDFV